MVDHLRVVAHQEVDRAERDAAGEVVVGKGRAVQEAEIVGPDVRTANARAYRHQPAAERFRDHQYVGRTGVGWPGKQRAGATQPGLDLVGDHEHAVAPAEIERRGQIAWRRRNDAPFTLDRFNDEGGHVAMIGGYPRGKCIDVAEG